MQEPEGIQKVRLAGSIRADQKNPLRQVYTDTPEIFPAIELDMANAHVGFPFSTLPDSSSKSASIVWKV
jgi:hypothetical protein